VDIGVAGYSRPVATTIPGRPRGALQGPVRATTARDREQQQPPRGERQAVRPRSTESHATNRENLLLPLFRPSARRALAWRVAAAAPARSEPGATHAGTATRTRVFDSREFSLGVRRARLGGARGALPEG
jgi:hypothetical protein